MPSLRAAFKPKVAIHDFAVTAREYRNFEAEFSDRSAHAIDCRVVLSWVACVGNEFVDRPELATRIVGSRGELHTPRL